MKYRIESPRLTYEAEKSPKEFKIYTEKLLENDTDEHWFLIEKYTKKYPIL